MALETQAFKAKMRSRRVAFYAAGRCPSCGVPGGTRPTKLRRSPRVLPFVREASAT